MHTSGNYGSTENMWRLIAASMIVGMVTIAVGAAVAAMTIAYIVVEGIAAILKGHGL